MTSKMIPVSARPLPYAMRTSQELGDWISGLYLRPRRLGMHPKVPPTWHEYFVTMPYGYIVIAEGRMVRCKGDTIEPITFAEPLPEGQIVFLVGQEAA